MKFYIFQETNEIRNPKINEFIIDKDGSIIKINQKTNIVKPIVSRIELNFPNNTHHIQMNPFMIEMTSDNYENSLDFELMKAYIITIPTTHFKPKVKKWQWLWKYKDNNFSTHYLTPPFATRDESYNYLKEIGCDSNIILIERFEIEE